MALRTIFGTKRKEERADWRKLYKEDLHDLYSSLNIIGLINLHGVCWQVHVVESS
jgi:hypothetical protein